MLGPSGYYTLMEWNDHEPAQRVYYIGYIIKRIHYEKVFFAQNKHE